ncbi:MAG: hypothetical protein NT120_03955 [Candidatus Aenigmarchaeota archaeon]|nr:hypothetical protein [Candidatus Aenigmarchaeota archaeon]
MRGQVALEYMLIFAFSLAALGILWYYSSANIDDARWDIQLAYAKSAMSKIAEVSELSYLQGPPAQFYVYPNFPDNVKNVYITANSITFEMKWKAILRNVSLETVANIAGSLGNYQGVHKILVKALDGSVQISEG